MPGYEYDIIQFPMRWYWLLTIVAIFVCALRSQPQESGDTAPASASSGERLFGSVCARCHGLDGRGGEHGPNIATAATITQRSDDELDRVIRNGRPAAGMPGFGSSLGGEQIHAVVSWLRILQGRQELRLSPGNPGKGRALYFGRARCSECHAEKGRGGYLAADLSSWAVHRSREEVRVAMTHVEVPPPVVVTTMDGRQWSGLMRNEDNFSLQLQTADGAFHFFRRDDLKAVNPTGFGPALTSEEVDDIAAFLLALTAQTR